MKYDAYDLDHGKPPLTEAAAEVFIDRAVQRRLARDAAYRNAATPTAQILREEEITAEEERRVYETYDVQ